MNTLDFIVDKFKLDLNIKKLPIEIPHFVRDDLGALFKELGFNTGVEVGTKKGIYAKTLCDANPGLKLYSIDPYERYEDYNDISSEKNKSLQQQARNYLVGCNVEYIYKYSADAVKDFDNESVDFVYIDGNHRFEYVVEDISKWIKKIRPGGIISGHDYFKNRYAVAQTTVLEAVHGYTESYRINPWFVLGRREVHSLDEKRDKPRSWMWVK